MSRVNGHPPDLIPNKCDAIHWEAELARDLRVGRPSGMLPEALPRNTGWRLSGALRSQWRRCRKRCTLGVIPHR